MSLSQCTSPHNLAVFTTRGILDGEEPILAVYHDADGDWQFIGATGGNDENGRIIGLENAMNMDPALKQLPDLPPRSTPSGRTPHLIGSGTASPEH